MKLNFCSKFYRIVFILTIIFFKLNADYQDVLVNNAIVASGVYSCEKRYKAFKPILNKFKRPFTTLDIGAAQGYFSLRTAYDYENSVAVMIEGGYYITPATAHIDPDKLLKICQQNSNLKNIIFLRNQVTIEDLQKLSLCEHFDVVYAFNIIHHFGKRCKEAFDVITSLGDYTIIELPSYANVELRKYVASKAPQILGIFDRPGPKGTTGTMRLYQKNKDSIKLKSYDYPDLLCQKKYVYKINSNFKEKKLIKLDDKDKVISERKWQPGINFCTFKLLNGIWPAKNSLIKCLHNIASEFNCGILPQDIIVQGRSLKLIKSKNSNNLNFKNYFQHILELISIDIDKKNINILYKLPNNKLENVSK